MSSACLNRHSDSFHEASIEAISLAALPASPLKNEETFPDVIPHSLTYIALPDNWHSNLILLPHNAIRAELIDLCTMLRSLSTWGRYSLLSIWFPLFHQFVTNYFTFEKEVLLPWVFSQADDSLLKVRVSLEAVKEGVLDALEELSHALILVTTHQQQPADVLPVVVRCAKELISRVEEYFQAEERMLPPVIGTTRTKEQAGYVEQLMAKKLDIGILLRWIPTRDRRVVRRRLGWWRWSRHVREHLHVVKQVCGT